MMFSISLYAADIINVLTHLNRIMHVIGIVVRFALDSTYCSESSDILFRSTCRVTCSSTIVGKMRMAPRPGRGVDATP